MPDSQGSCYRHIQSLKRFECDAGEPAAPRLCRQLRLSNNPRLFKKIQTTIEKLGETYLDINATVSEQQDVMSLIEDEIMSKHPHLFAGRANEASLFFVLRIVIQQHRRHRKRLLKRRGRKLAKNRKDAQHSNEFLDLTLDGQQSDSESESSANFDDKENLDQEEPQEAFRPHPALNRLPPLPPLPALAPRMPLTARATPNTHPSVHVTNGFKSNHTTMTNNLGRSLPTTPTKPATTKHTSQTVHTLEVQRF